MELQTLTAQPLEADLPCIGLAAFVLVLLSAVQSGRRQIVFGRFGVRKRFAIAWHMVLIGLYFTRALQSTEGQYPRAYSTASPFFLRQPR